MCGIVMLLDEKTVEAERLEILTKLIDNRGPDYQSPLIDYTDGSIEFKLKSSVLHLRGEEIKKQPVIDEIGNVLLFNGLIYHYHGYSEEQLDRSTLEDSDTSFLANKLQCCKTVKEISLVLAKVIGPYAFIYWSKELKTLVYGRDLFGRRSLCSLEKENASAPVIISSVADENLESHNLKWSEVDCNDIHFIDFGHPSQIRRYTCKRHHHYTFENMSGMLSPDIDLTTSIMDMVPLNRDLTSSKDFDQVELQRSLDGLEKIFLEVVRRQYKSNKTTCLICRRDGVKNQCCSHPKVAVAFSGGLDSTIIALALDKILDEDDSVDLVTVAFKPNSPDRRSVGDAFKELVKISPRRNWRLVLCDVSVAELQQVRNDKIRRLILPCDTVLDDALGCASWFVGRATGRMVDRITTTSEWMSKHFESFLRYDPPPSGLDKAQMYTSPASMIFAGSGIDEQLGGYSSHRAAWSKLGTRGLLDEVAFLMCRLSSRNQGRDDRAYSDHGRDLRLPFLDHRMVSFLNRLPMGLKMNLDQPLDVGPKKILRLLAFEWGLEETSVRVKRAMQFGTRIANLENSKEKGNDICVRLKTACRLNGMDD